MSLPSPFLVDVREMSADEALHHLTDRAIARFWSRVDQSAGVDACWPWTACLSGDGYGKTQFGPKNGQKQYRAHRVALFLASNEIGEVAMHACDTPVCCNPRHLSWGTQLDNRADCAAKGRTARGDRHGTRLHPEIVRRGALHPRAKLTETQAAEIRASYVPGGANALAVRFGVGRGTIMDVVTGRRYGSC